MGWTSFNFNGTKAEFIEYQFNREPKWGNVIDYSIKGNVLYIAVKLGENHGEQAGEITALIVLTSVKRNTYYNFSYKDMTEGCGPSQSDCPKRILDMLSPVEKLYCEGSKSREWATEWRNRCRTHKPKGAKVRIGDTIKLAHSVKTTFGNFQLFRCVARNMFYPLSETNGKLEPLNRMVKFRPSRFEFSIEPQQPQH